MFDITLLDKFPKNPGVYIMKDEKGSVLYVGKAKSLQVRVKQYFSKTPDSRPTIPYLIEKVQTIETIVVFSEKEAFLLENTLIKQHQPKYNILLKDDKTYVSLRLSKHEWPKVELMRYKGKPPKGGIYFGPYLSAYAARSVLEILQHSFPLRQCSDRELVSRIRPCILYQMKRCVAPCCNKCTKEEYDMHVKHTIQFLKGQNKELLKELRKEMEKHAEVLEFEDAARIRNAISNIEKTLESQKVATFDMIDLDALGLYREGDEVIISQLLFREGNLSGAESFHFHKSLQDDDELFESFLLQHYAEKEYAPKEILLPIKLDSPDTLEEILTQGKEHKVTISTPQRGDRRKFIEMAEANAKAYFSVTKDAKAQKQKMMLDLQEKLHLEHYPYRIDCFDNSHLSGSESVAAMVVYIDGEKTPSLYRKYTLREAKMADDYGSMYEVLSRRYSKAKNEDALPNLVLIDGGKGHLNIARKVFADLNIITVDIVAIAKEEGRHDKGASAEQIYLPERKDPIILNRNSPLLFLLQQIRDEAHRFAITFQKVKRSKKIIKTSLVGIPGIGPTKAQRLLQKFGSIKQIKLASKEELAAVKGITSADILQIFKFAQEN